MTRNSLWKIDDNVSAKEMFGLIIHSHPLVNPKFPRILLPKKQHLKRLGITGQREQILTFQLFDTRVLVRRHRTLKSVLRFS
jgi:hypothetical protein